MKSNRYDLGPVQVAFQFDFDDQGNDVFGCINDLDLTRLDLAAPETVKKEFAMFIADSMVKALVGKESKIKQDEFFDDFDFIVDSLIADGLTYCKIIESNVTYEDEQAYDFSFSINGLSVYMNVKQVLTIADIMRGVLFNTPLPKNNP